VYLTAEEQISCVLRHAIAELDPIEAAFVEGYYLHQPRVTLSTFATEWGLSGKALSELRIRVLAKMKQMLEAQNVTSMRDILWI
jgi:hypothetical protein